MKLTSYQQLQDIRVSAVLRGRCLPAMATCRLDATEVVISFVQKKQTKINRLRADDDCCSQLRLHRDGCLRQRL